MIDYKTASLLGDYLVINVASSNSVAIPGGKAGVGLVLFELSRKLDDERIGDYAFNMISEMMASKTTSLSIMNGEMCVGYTLMYLMNEEFIDICFDTHFGERHRKIVDFFVKQIDKDETGAIVPADLWYFLQYLAYNKECPYLFDKLIDRVLLNVEQYIAQPDMNPVLANLFYRQLSVLSKITKFDDKLMARMRCIESNLLRFVNEHNIKYPLLTTTDHFVSQIRDSVILGNSCVEIAITQTPILGLNNSYKVMLLLLEWLYTENPSANLGQLRSILGVFQPNV